MADEPDDGLTEGERKFFQSKGEDISGIPPSEIPPPADAPPAESAPPVEGETAPAAEAAPAEDADDASDVPETPEPITDIDPRTGKKPPKNVHWNKFKRTRDQLEAAQKELADRGTENATLRETMARADERLKLINEALATPSQEQQQAEDEDPAPDPKEDIFGFVAWQGRQQQRLFERLNEKIEGVTNYQTQQVQQTALVTNYKQDAARFAAQQPRFADAYGYLLRNRGNELLKAGVKDPQKRNEIMQDEERSLVQAAFNEHTSPAQRVFDIAVARGFNPNAEVPAAAPKLAATKPTAPAVVSVPGKPNVGAEIDAIKNGQSAAFSLGNAGGAPAPTLTPEVLGNMSEEEFGRFYDSLSRDKIRQLLPGA